MSKGILYAHPNLQQMYCVDFQRNEIRIFKKNLLNTNLQKYIFFAALPLKKANEDSHETQSSVPLRSA